MYSAANASVLRCNDVCISVGRSELRFFTKMLLRLPVMTVYWKVLRNVFGAILLMFNKWW